MQRLAGLTAQKTKALQSHERDRDSLMVRRDDLNVQLDEMQRKYRVSGGVTATFSTVRGQRDSFLTLPFPPQERMTEFSARKNRALEAHLDAEQRQKELHRQVSNTSLHAESVDSHSPIPHAGTHSQLLNEQKTDNSEASSPKTASLV